MRRQLGPDPDPYAVAILELHTYSPAIVGFIRATAANPDILTDADLDGSSVVVDVGAFVGEWSERIHERYGPTIHAFEPNPSSFRALRDRIGGRPGVSLHPFGLGGRDERTTLDPTDGPGASTHGTSSGDHLATVEVRDVAAVLDELAVAELDLVKLNIEGAEYDLLDRLLDTGWASRIRLLSVQFHEWHPHAHRRRREVRRRLAATHDEVWDHPWVWELWRRRDGVDQKTIGTVSPG